MRPTPVYACQKLGSCRLLYTPLSDDTGNKWERDRAEGKRHAEWPLVSGINVIVDFVLLSGANRPRLLYDNTTAP